MINYKFTTQYNFDAENSAKHAHSDDVITIPDDSFTIQELMQRAIANTLPPLANHYDDDYDDVDISFDDELQFFQPSDFQELHDMRVSIDKRILELSTELEQSKKVTLAPDKEPKSDNTDDNTVE